MTRISPDLAQRELARREKARRDLLYFCHYTFPAYQLVPHLALLAEYLHAIECGEINRLIVTMPPRHGKSEMISVRFPAWYLGRNPDKRVILTSYAGELAQIFSRQVRNLIGSSEYNNVFGQRSALDAPVQLAADSQAAQAWNLDGFRGGMRAAGVGGGITGMGADLLIIDDPVKDRAEAESQAIRNATDAWFGSTAYTRLEENAAIVLMLTRWHHDDLAGRLLQRMADDPLADHWQILNLPALAGENDPLGRSPGEALWPGKYPADVLHTIRANIGSYDFEALYQQRPRDSRGGVLDPAWFSVVDHAPDGLAWSRFWDLATSTKQKAHYTASPRLAFAPDGYLYIADMVRGRWEWPDAKKRILEMARLEPGVAIGVEEVAFQLAAFQELLREPDLLNHAVRGVRPVGDKLARALPWISRAEAGKVRLVRGAWVKDFLDEAAQFPLGAFDDQIDGVSGGVAMLGGAGPAAGVIVNDIPADVYKSAPHHAVQRAAPLFPRQGRGDRLWPRS